MSNPQPAEQTEILRFGQALNRALGDAMRADDKVFLMGEDIPGRWPVWGYPQTTR